MNAFASISIETYVAFAGAVISVFATVCASWMTRKFKIKAEKMLVTVQGKDGHKTEFTLERDDFERRFRNLHPKSESDTPAASH
jgi:hypothetical protein